MDIRRIFDHPIVFGLSQRLIPFTVWVYEELAAAHLSFRPGDQVLDIGCGLGAHRLLLRGTQYTGIDINPNYIAQANRRFGGGFLVMDASRLEFQDASFDSAISIATCHHLDDTLVRLMIKGALRVIRSGGALHIIDPVLPIRKDERLKRFVFENDRGRHQRTLEGMQRLVSRIHPIADQDFRSGLLHDVAYFRLERN